MIGTPHTRWREMHQSGRVAIMLEMRSSPQAGIHFTSLMASSVRARRSLRSMPTNHCSVARKMVGMVAAPAMRIAVLDLFFGQQRAVRLQNLDDQRIRLPDGLSDAFLGQAAQPRLRRDRTCPRRSTGTVHRKPVFHADDVVFLPVAGSGVNRAGSLFERHVIAQDAERIALQKRMTEDRCLPSFAPGKLAITFGDLPAAAFPRWPSADPRRRCRPRRPLPPPHSSNFG